ncbi:MAG: hypothetical protein USCAAHI_03077 [Beijerinckiaceae bacterium]|nr:MAG: hypothetical protein USCAAHI_03077 [Beijerinckiaceae bacterium]
MESAPRAYKLKANNAAPPISTITGTCPEIVSALYDKHIATVEQIGGISSEEFARLNLSLVRLERFWTDQIRYRL